MTDPPRRLDPDRAAAERAAGAGRLDPDRAAAERAAGAGRLDPDRAATERAAEAAGATEAPPPARPPRRSPPDVDTRRYRWTIGIFGLTLVLVFSVWSFARNGVGSPGVPAGKRLHPFVAPLATGGLEGDANVRPRCDPARPNPRALNVCGRQPLVLAFFVTDSSACTRQVNALQALSADPRLRALQFAAVAVHADRRTTLAAVRRRGWTIPVAYDRDGSIGELYGVQVCPLLELARPGGIVARRLIGERWSTPSALRPQLAVLGAG